jgi:hypothetical protein
VSEIASIRYLIHLAWCLDCVGEHRCPQGTDLRLGSLQELADRKAFA